MATVAEPARWATEPFTTGTPEQFTRLREWLRRVHFTESELCADAGVPTIAHFTSAEAGRKVFAEPADAVSLLVRLFFDGARLPWSVVRGVLSHDELSILTDLGLLQPSVADAAACAATVALFPTEDLYLVSDRVAGLETVGMGLPADLVYTPLTKEARHYVAMMPRVECGDYLEMCAGTGIAALLAAKQFARHAYSADITERCTRFARFNAALNGLENFTAVQGDLYEPVKGKTFDIIAAHPPYVPAEETAMVFRDGGADGEQITRRIVAGVSEHLNPGGLFYLECMLTERADDPIERRVRRMLGPLEDEFDVLVVRGAAAEAKAYLAERLASGHLSPEAFTRQSGLFRRSKIEWLVGVTTLIQRRTAARPVITRHHTIGPDTRAEDVRWLLGYLSGTVEWGDEENRRLLDGRLRALPGTELRTTSVLRDGAWVETGLTIATSIPFSASSACPAWFPRLLARCDGRATVRDLLGWLRAEGAVPEAMTDDDFAGLIRELADVPYVELDAYPLPERGSGNPPRVA